MSPVQRAGALLRQLLRRDPAGQPVPVALAELRGEEGTAAQKRLERDLQQLSAAGWVIRRQSVGTGRGRTPAELVLVWALLPGEALIV